MSLVFIESSIEANGSRFRAGDIPSRSRVRHMRKPSNLSSKFCLRVTSVSTISIHFLYRKVSMSSRIRITNKIEEPCVITLV